MVYEKSLRVYENAISYNMHDLLMKNFQDQITSSYNYNKVHHKLSNYKSAPEQPLKESFDFGAWESFIECKWNDSKFEQFLPNLGSFSVVQSIGFSGSIEL